MKKLVKFLFVVSFLFLWGSLFACRHRVPPPIIFDGGVQTAPPQVSPDLDVDKIPLGWQRHV